MIVFIKTCTNVQGNEQVDRLANTASVIGNSLDKDIFTYWGCQLYYK